VDEDADDESAVTTDAITADQAATRLGDRADAFPLSWNGSAKVFPLPV
jgi:hypothetical protein